MDSREDPDLTYIYHKCLVRLRGVFTGALEFANHYDLQVDYA
jgi:hypothetical protein